MATNTTTPTAEPTRHRWRDARLGAALKALRPHVDASGERALTQLVDRLRYVDRVLTNWDAHHQQQATAYLAAGKMEAASTSAWLVFDEEAQRNLLAKITIGVDPDELAERHARNAEMEREVAE